MSKISKALPVMKYSEEVTNLLYRKVGIRMIPLNYLLRSNATPEISLTALVPGIIHSENNGSIE